jgi:hypothetical protein
MSKLQQWIRDNSATMAVSVASGKTMLDDFKLQAEIRSFVQDVVSKAMIAELPKSVYRSHAA